MHFKILYKFGEKIDFISHEVCTNGWTLHCETDADNVSVYLYTFHYI